MEKKWVSLNEQKSISLTILEYVDEICKRNNIEYFLGYGTLLGAVRHKGFIPWDDDIDIIMFRDNYEKFLSIMKKNGKYGCLSFEDMTYHSPYTKIVDLSTRMICEGKKDIPNLGIGIDIFPFDYFYGKNLKEVMKEKKKLNFYEKLIRYSLYRSYSEVGSFKFTKYLFYKISQSHDWKYWALRYKNKIEKYKNIE